MLIDTQRRNSLHKIDVDDEDSMQTSYNYEEKECVGNTNDSG